MTEQDIVNFKKIESLKQNGCVITQLTNEGSHYKLEFSQWGINSVWFIVDKLSKDYIIEINEYIPKSIDWISINLLPKTNSTLK